MAITVKVQGLRDLEKALEGIEKHTTRKALARRVLKKAGQPLADSMNAMAPVGQGDLNTSYAVSTKLNKSQRRATRRKKKDDVMMYVGTNDPAGIQQEFGNVNHGPQPHVRPAWDSGKRQALEDIKDGLGTEIIKTAKREAAKKAKA